jgi:hypothetical protein
MELEIWFRNTRRQAGSLNYQYATASFGSSLVTARKNDGHFCPGLTHVLPRLDSMRQCNSCARRSTIAIKSHDSFDMHRSRNTFQKVCCEHFVNVAASAC